MNTVGRILRAIREARCLSHEQVARRMGCKNVQKVSRKLRVAEVTGVIKDDMLMGVLEVLDVDLATFEEMTETLYVTGQEPPVPPRSVNCQSSQESACEDSENTGK